jgi:hypothetical protein
MAMKFLSARIAATLLSFAFLAVGTKAQTAPVSLEQMKVICAQNPGLSVLVDATAGTVQYTCPLPEPKPVPTLAPASAQQTMSPSDVAYCQLRTTDSFCLRGGAPAPQVAPMATPTPLPYVNSTQSDCKTISFAVATHNGVQSYYPGWIDSWVKKNAKKFPTVCFAQRGGQNAYVVIMSTSHNSFNGLQVVRVTTTTPFSGGGNGTVTDNYGGTWEYTYTYDGTVTTSENVAAPYVINSNTLYATAYDSRGNVVAESNHVYSSQTGGDPYNSLGYNLGSALAAINARGRMLTGVVKTISK